MATAHPSWLTDGNTARLIQARAARLGLHREGFEDARQEILVQLSAFRLDPLKANGAKTTTVLVTIIDRRLRMWARSRRRYRERLAQIRKSCEARRRASGLAHPAYEERMEMVLDVRQSVASLNADDRRLCRALSDGRTLDDIAGELGCSWHTVKRRIDRLRARFEAMNLDAWLRG